MICKDFLSNIPTGEKAVFLQYETSFKRNIVHLTSTNGRKNHIINYKEDLC